MEPSNEGLKNPGKVISAGLEGAFHSILPTAQEESRIEKVRRALGDDVKELSDDELEVYLTEFSFLLDSWLDSYEKQVFDGQTLQQRLREV